MAGILLMILDDLTDNDFATYVITGLPQIAQSVVTYVKSPHCAECIRRVTADIQKWEPELQALLVKFRTEFGRDPKVKHTTGRTPLTGTRIVKPNDYRNLIRDLANQHTWSAMTTQPQKDGTWLLTFS